MSEFFIIHIGEPIPMSTEEGMDLLKAHFSELRNNLAENDIKEINDLQLSLQQD